MATGTLETCKESLHKNEFQITPCNTGKKKLVIPVKPVLLVGCTVIVSDGDSLKFCGRKIFAKKKTEKILKFYKLCLLLYKGHTHFKIFMDKIIFCKI